MAIAILGKVVINHSWWSDAVPELSIAPHADSGGWAPRPIELSAAAERIEPAIPSEAHTISVESAFDRMRWKMIASFVAPAARAASTKSRPCRPRTWPRRGRT